MAYGIYSMAGAQPITTNADTQKHVLGTRVMASDPTFGDGEFIYLKGVINTVVGLVVTYNATDYTTTVSPNTASNAAPVAVAMSACVASQFGWYQISGNATVKKTAVQCLPGTKVYQSGTGGRIMPTSASGKQILGAKGANLVTVTSTTSTLVVQLNYPFMQGQIT